MPKQDEKKTLIAQGWQDTEGDRENPIPNEGNTIVGTYVNKKIMKLNGNEVALYELRVGNTFKGLLGGAVLDDRFSKVPIGSEVWVRYDGDEPAKTKGFSPTKLYSVMFKAPTNGHAEAPAF